MPRSGPEGDVRRQVDRLLAHADWNPADIVEEQNLLTGRMDYLLDDLCILETKKATSPNSPHELKLHLQQAQRYGKSVDHIPFLIVSDGELHFIQDTRNRRIARLFAFPTKQELLMLKSDPDALLEDFIIVSPNLFDFQKRALLEAVKGIIEGRTRLLLEMATGTGKTMVAAEIISEMNRVILEREDRRISVLFLVDRDTLEEQAAVKLGRQLGTLKVKTVGELGERVDVLVAQVATMQNRFANQPFHPKYFDLVVVDEAHRSVHGGVWRNIIEYFDCPQVGLTATPARFNDDETIAYFGLPVFLYSYESGVEGGILAPFKIHRVKTNVDKVGIAVEGRFYESPDFGIRVHIDNRDWAIARYYAEHFYGRKCLVFAASTKQVESLWQKFNDIFASKPENYRAQFVVSSVESPKERQAIVEEFADSSTDVKVLINLNILTAGFDFPELGLLFMCRYTENKSLYQQMKGRGSRLPLDAKRRIKTDEHGNPIKDHFVMVDFVGVTEWENDDFQPHINARLEENGTEAATNQDPGAASEMISVDVEVGIAEVKIIDPFEGKESPVIRQLRRQLENAERKLAEERALRKQEEESSRAVRRSLNIQQARALSIQCDAFRNLIVGLRTLSPFTPITEEVLSRILPNVFTATVLNEAFGVRLGSVQAHINALVDALRYEALVNQKHIAGIGNREIAELDALEKNLSSLDGLFYRRLIDRLRSPPPEAGEE